MAACDEEPSTPAPDGGEPTTHSHNPGDEGHSHDVGAAGSAGVNSTAGDATHQHAPEPSAAQGSELMPPPGTVLGDFKWQLPQGWRLPVVPLSNPMSTAKVELGRRLFYDKRVSANETQSCASCHKQELAFTDGRATGLGSTGEAHLRGPMAMMNLAYTPSLTWASRKFAMDVSAQPLEDQAAVPLFGVGPVELGQTESMLEARLREIPEYKMWFSEAFPEDPEPITAQNVQRALASFERVLISGNSLYDRANRNEASLTESQQRGSDLFNGEKFECFHCHSQFSLSDHVHWQGKSKLELRYHNNGLYNVDGKGGYPEQNTGLHHESGVADDMGMFKVPSLRNIAVTAPYMHDGSIKTLSEVLDHYAAGGRTIKDGPNAGVGSKNPNKDPLVRGFEMTEQERQDVIAFLESLTDEEFLTNPAFADPWQQD
jgi:cytochrome c peroxidase